MSVGLYSYATDDLNTDIKLYQKKVFNSFDLNIQQIILEKQTPLHVSHPYNYNSHADALTHIIKTSPEIISYFLILIVSH